MVTFGKPAAERKAARISRAGTFWMKTFRDPETKVRFLWDDPENNWIEYREHFDRTAKMSYPCARAEGAETCIGCDHPEEAVQKAGSKWAFPVLDDRDYVQVYKIGVKFWKALIGQHRLFGTLTDRDYAVMKMGEDFNEITYQAVPVSQPFERTPQIAIPDIGELLKAKYVEAMAVYGYDDTDDAAEAAPAPQQTPAVPHEDPAVVSQVAEMEEQGILPARRDDPASRLLAEGQNRAASKGAEPSGVEPDEVPDFNVMATADIKAWLAQRNVEFPANAPRSRLIKDYAIKAAVGF